MGEFFTRHVGDMEVKMTEFNSKVYKIVAAIPLGKVATYGQIAAMLGSPFAARAVGTALSNTPSGMDIPCHRVVSKSGELAPGEAFGGVGSQRRMLEEEGLAFENSGSIDIKKYLWRV